MGDRDGDGVDISSLPTKVSFHGYADGDRGDLTTTTTPKVSLYGD